VAQVKAALTRAYNKARHALPFSTTADVRTGKRGKKIAAVDKDNVVEDGGEELGDSADEDVLAAQIGDYEDL